MVKGDNYGLAPIALFVYNRPDHTRRTLQRLSMNPLAKKSSLYIFCDGPHNVGDALLVEEVRRVIREQAWCGQVTIREQAENHGLAASIIAGVTELVRVFERVIVLEDDLLVAPHFLDYMNEGLRRYAAQPKVMQIAGYLAPIEIDNDGPAKSFFLPLTTSWGWATWKRAWDHFEPTAAGYEEFVRNPAQQRAFNLDDTVDYSTMLRESREGRNCSWAVRWYFSVFLCNGLTLYPEQSLVQNIGFDGSGVHAIHSFGFETQPCAAKISVYPSCIAHDEDKWEKLKAYFSRAKKRKTERKSLETKLPFGQIVAAGLQSGFAVVRSSVSCVNNFVKLCCDWVVRPCKRWQRMRYEALAKKTYELAQFGEKLSTIHQFSCEATIASGARIFSEAVVRNLHGDPERIRVGDNTVIRGELVVFAHAGKICIGQDCYVGDGTRIWSSDSITIGNRALISHAVNIHDTNSHPLDAESRHKHYLQIVEFGHPKKDIEVAASPVRIGDDAWIGFNATILKGVKIGRGAIVAAGSVVVKDVPDNAIVAGNPAKVIRHYEDQKNVA